LFKRKKEKKKLTAIDESRLRAFYLGMDDESSPLEEQFEPSPLKSSSSSSTITSNSLSPTTITVASQRSSLSPETIQTSPSLQKSSQSLIQKPISQLNIGDLDQGGLLISPKREVQRVSGQLAQQGQLQRRVASTSGNPTSTSENNPSNPNDSFVLKSLAHGVTHQDTSAEMAQREKQILKLGQKYLGPILNGLKHK